MTNEWLMAATIPYQWFQLAPLQPALRKEERGKPAGTENQYCRSLRSLLKQTIGDN